MVIGGFLDVKHYPKFDYNVEEKNSVVHTRENWTKVDLKADAKTLLKWKTKYNVGPFGGSAFAQNSSNPTETHGRLTPVTMINLEGCFENLAI